MMIYKHLFYFLCFTSVLLSCSNDIKEVNALVSKNELHIEKAKNVEILYSDSAVVRMKIVAPEMDRHISKSDAKEVWPKGLHVDFYDNNAKTSAWLDAKYAIRINKDNKIIVKDSVVLHNQDGDILKTSKLIWDQKKELLSTNEFVQIVQSTTKDTIRGYGFETDKDFKKFVIKRKFSSKRFVDF